MTLSKSWEGELKINLRHIVTSKNLNKVLERIEDKQTILEDELDEAKRKKKKIRSRPSDQKKISY